MSGCVHCDGSGCRRCLGDHPYFDPGDGRTECRTCGKWVWPVVHSCKGVPVTVAALARMRHAR
jgi:hypothetical protein